MADQDSTEDQTFNTSSFPEVTTLELHSWDLACTPEFACSAVLGPKLHTFIYNINDIGSPKLFRFHDHYASWISEFGELAAARNSALRTIDIRFDAVSSMMPSSWATYDRFGYPWDCMEDAKSRLAMVGVSLKWSPEPFISKEQLERRIKYQEKELDEC